MKNIKYYLISIFSLTLIFSANSNAAYDDAGTDYSKDSSRAWVDMGPAMRPLNFTSMLVCIMKKSGASLVVNGTYNALINFSECQVGSSSSKPEIVKLKVITSRESNSSPQKVTVWFIGKDSAKYVTETTITEGVSSTAPFGSFTFSWSHKDPSVETGTMSFTPKEDGSGTTIKMIKNSKDEGVISLHGEVANDKKSGKVRVDYSGNTFAVNFNETHVNIKKGSDAAECSNRASLTEYVYSYSLYDQTTGARKNLTGPFSCTYDSSGTTKQCHIGPYGGWFEGGESNITTVTHKDGTVYSGITYDADDANNDGIYITVPGYDFSPPLYFNKADQVAGVQSIMGTWGLQYYGKHALYGLPWNCSNDGVTFMSSNGNDCSSAVAWRPAVAIANGTVLTDTSSDVYVTKAVESMKVMASAAGSCGALSVDSVLTDYPALTTSDIKSVTTTFADRPSDLGDPKVIDGVVQ